MTAGSIRLFPRLESAPEKSPRTIARGSAVDRGDAATAPGSGKTTFEQNQRWERQLADTLTLTIPAPPELVVLGL